MKKRTYEITALDTPCGPLTLKFIEIQGELPGPTLVLVSGVHGDEVSSVGGLRVFLDHFLTNNSGAPMVGKIIALPFANPIALMQRTWGFHLSVVSDVAAHENLNRCFPGDPNGTVGERMASAIFQHVLSLKPDLVVDLHTIPSRSLPCVIIDRIPMADGLKERVWEPAKTFGIGVVHDFPVEQYVKEKLDASLSGAFISAGIPAFTVEVPGGPVSQHESEEILKYGLWNIASFALGLAPERWCRYGFPDWCPRAHRSWIILSTDKQYACSPGPRADCAGFFKPIEKLIERSAPVKKDEMIGEIWDRGFQNATIVKSSVDGYIASFSDVSVVSEGDLLCWFFVEEKK